MELRTFTSIAEDILGRPPRRGGTRIVAVDGGSAAGKSTFAPHAVLTRSPAPYLTPYLAL